MNTWKYVNFQRIWNVDNFLPNKQNLWSPLELYLLLAKEKHLANFSQIIVLNVHIQYQCSNRSYVNALIIPFMLQVDQLPH